MAGSRLANYGTIFSRTTGLLKSGGIKDVPIWYEVYKRHPPELEPNVERPLPPQDPVPEIVYEEDFEKARDSGNRYKTQGGRMRSRTRLPNVVKTITDDIR